MFADMLQDARLVVIDDVAANLRLLVSSLRAFGAREVVPFSDSAEGLAWLQANPWDLLLLDLDMPAPDGFTILRALADRDRSTAPIITVTALAEAEQRRLGLQLGANDYICKPLDLPELLLRVRHNLQLSQAARQLAGERDALVDTVRQRNRQLHDSYEQAVAGLARATSYKDPETGHHLQRIGEAAALLAAALGQPAAWVEQLRFAATMHDVGKIGVPDAILGKPGRLTEDELQLMRRHSRIGYEILQEHAGSAFAHLAAEVALNHHERWDGSGYPNGLAGEAIPLSARIVALCDVYDALRSPRVYKHAWSAEQAQALIRDEAGKAFDPALVTVMVGLFPRIEALLARTAMATAGASPVFTAAAD